MRIQFFDFWVLSYLATHLLLWLRVLADGNCLLPTAANSSTQPACVSTRSVFDKYLPFSASDRLFSSNNGSAELIQTAEIHMYIQVAGACYLGKSVMAVLFVVLQRAGLGFRPAAVVAFATYAALLLCLLPRPTPTSWLYVVAAVLLLLEQRLSPTESGLNCEGGQQKAKPSSSTRSIVRRPSTVNSLVPRITLTALMVCTLSVVYRCLT